MIQTDLLQEDNTYVDGKRVITQTIRQTRAIWDDYEQLSEVYSTLAKLYKKAAPPQEPQVGLQESITKMRDMADTLKRYIDGYEEVITDGSIEMD